jgi:NAD(P)-dependent dehydrogenase (short-subunit alcohol dehydrogenase family)
MERLLGKTAIVTGAAQGLGAAIAARFCADGASVVIADVNEEALTATANSIGPACSAFPCDVRSEESVANLVAFACDSFGRLDIMVNNAGILGPVGSITDVDIEAALETIRIHLIGTISGIKHASRVMRAQRHGVILNTASTAGLRGGLGPHVYTAAKHAIVGLTESAATELVHYNIRVNAIAPGGHLTPLVARVLTGREDDFEGAEKIMIERSPQGRAAKPEDIAGAYVYLASDEAWFANGACLVVDGAREVPGNLASMNATKN